MAQHTPGPWHVGVQNDGLHIITAAAPGEAECIASLTRADRTADADARLIASAPDLLAALEAIMVQAVAGDMEDRWEEECAAAHAAIAKAKGAD